MNVELFIYIKQYLLGKCHTLMKRLLDIQSGPNLPIRLFFCLLPTRPGADKAYWLIYIILDFVLGLIDLCWIKHESSRYHAVCFSLKWQLKWARQLPGKRFSNDGSCKKGVISVVESCLSNDDGNENGKKKQNNNAALASPFIVHFFAVVGRLRCETS